MADSIVKTVNVPLPPKRAFELFTAEMADWWPLETHSLSAQDKETAQTVTVTPKVGGEITETRQDGTTAPWGRVTDWEPGKRFGMRWCVGRPDSEGTQVDVRFDAVADGTRVTLVHSGWDALGDAAVAMQKSYSMGWQSILDQRYAKACREILAIA